jgi:hypothetical protein
MSFKVACRIGSIGHSIYRYMIFPIMLPVGEFVFLPVPDDWEDSSMLCEIKSTLVMGSYVEYELSPDYILGEEEIQELLEIGYSRKIPDTQISNLRKNKRFNRSYFIKDRQKKTARGKK